jgi:hypothetical protein
MKDNRDDQTDAEWKTLLSPLQNVEAGRDRLERWRGVVEEEFARDHRVGANVVTVSFNRRVAEWAIAASIGFVMAAAWMGFSDEESHVDYFSGIDATEMHLVAKSD